MATNKTRLSYYDYNNTEPYSADIFLEFDIYQDAIDYVETFCNRTKTIIGSQYYLILLFSYDNDSFSYLVNGATITKSEITFPELLS